jgi:hypothetical protein
MVRRAFSALNGNPGLVLAPVLKDLASLLLGLMTAGFWGEPQASFILALDVGLPTISTVLENNVLSTGVDLDLAGGGAGVPLLLALLFFLLRVLIEAGFIGLLCDLARGIAPTLTAFVSYSKRFWQRMLGLRLLTLVFTAILGTLAMLLPVIGIIAFPVILFVLRVKFIYWEYTMVSEDIGIAEAFGRSGLYFAKRTPQLHGIVIGIVLLNFIAAFLVNMLWSPEVIFISIPFYCYLATALQLALMGNKLELDDAAPEFAAE